MRDNALKSILMICFQLILISISVIVAYYFSRHFDIIPRKILHLPTVYVSTSDMWTMLRVFAVTYAIQIITVLIITRITAFETINRFALEYMFYLVAYTTGSLYIFLATTINYDAQFIAAFGVFSTLAYVLSYYVYGVKNGESIFTFPFRIFASLIKRLFSLSGLLVLLYFITPLLLGKAFVSDRDIANKITQVRIFFNPIEESDWGFKNHLPGKTFAQPVLAKQSPNDESEIYVLERKGKLFSASSLNSDLPTTLVIDLSDKLGEVEIENGALGFAFHPRFSESIDEQPYIYVYYTDSRPSEFQYNRLSRFDLSLPTLDERNLSEEIILEMRRSKSGFHNGGSVEFGLDGFLYLGLGEGVHPKEATRYNQVFRSGVLRLDIDMDEEKSAKPTMPFNHGLAQNYLVPKDNPFIGNSDVLDEYWALGLRNPFRFNFDPQTGQLWLGDVGSTVWEEVNIIEKGKHYQFPGTEGESWQGKRVEEPENMVFQGPYYAYEHNAYDRAVIGGVINRGETYPGLEGQYIFADNYSAKLFMVDPLAEQSSPTDQKAVPLARANQYAQRGISSVVQLRSGTILVTTLGAASSPTGEVLQLVDAQYADITAAEETTKQAPSGYNEQATEELFAVNCARCHGVTGDGNGPDSEMLGVEEMPDFTSPLYQFSVDSTDIKAIIELGGIGVNKSPMMPPWKGFLEPNQIDHLVTYIESLPDKHHKH
ncbi:PQQ-dependent sugar dehydrogenase [Vibrio ulleungensis]|uniref:PQQ-dependent sugar dehydrogenase n=1 Tax=Vibrio ulleungensis TaxID=2807619 RepID=A0ABS2HE50_9VIBR|nr:PQQ-dependent sugar dehydrogenase [Vibrio ulleungensis]MBM7035865.1 PQQ-dependent sugar dehydrogenase [Vibrio ulleungensis]